jgi:hypothetical protein
VEMPATTFGAPRCVEQIYFFSHVPRTGGTVIASYLNAAFTQAGGDVWPGSAAMHNITCGSESHRPSSFLTRLASLSFQWDSQLHTSTPSLADWAARVRGSGGCGLFYGHATPNFARACGLLAAPHVKVLTVVREPVAHLLSQSNVVIVCQWARRRRGGGGDPTSTKRRSRLLDDACAHDMATTSDRALWHQSERSVIAMNATQLAEAVYANQFPEWSQSRFVGECGSSSTRVRRTPAMPPAIVPGTKGPPPQHMQELAHALSRAGAGRGAWAPSIEKYDRACTERALATLTRIEWLGLTERLSASLCLLHTQTGLPTPITNGSAARFGSASDSLLHGTRGKLDPSAPRRSASAQVATFIELEEPELYAALSTALRPEIDFYNGAKREFERRLRSLAPSCAKIQR